LVAGVWILVAIPAVAQQPPCAATLAGQYSDASPDLGIALDSLSPDQKTAALGWADCQAGHHNLAQIFEVAVRSLDASKTVAGTGSYFLSPAQSVSVSEPAPPMARRLIITVLRGVPEAALLIEPSLRPPAGDQGWTALLADLNAETHSLQAWTSLNGKGLVKPDTSVARDELAAAMLATVAFLEVAKDTQPKTFDALASSATSVDAFALLWKRAEDALQASEGSKLGARDEAILTAVYAHTPAVRALFERAGRPAPSALTRPVAVGVASQPAAPTVAVAPAVSPSDAAVKAPPVGAGPPAAQDLEPLRLALVALMLITPWALVLALFLLRRRRYATFVGFANRSLAIATLLVVVEALVLIFVVSSFGSEVLLTQDALYLLAAPYLFGVLLVTLGRLDKEGQLASRRIVVAWAKWGGAIVGVLVVVNITVAVFWPPLALFAIPGSMALVGILASVFLVKLWRSGTQKIEAKPESAKPQKPEGPRSDGKAPESDKSAPSPAPIAAPLEARPKTVKNEPPPVADDAEDVATEAPNSASAMSDDDLAAAFEAMDSGSSGSADVPEDRADLYKLLDKLDK
jgi:hypothetical protein